MYNVMPFMENSTHVKRCERIFTKILMMIVSGSEIAGDFYFFPYFFLSFKCYIMSTYHLHISGKIGLPWWSNG